MSAKDSILALAANTTVIPLADVRQKTHELIRQAGDHRAQVELIQDVFELIVNGTEVTNEIICEAWGMLMHEGLWQAKFTSKDEASAIVDSSLLLDVRKRAKTNRDRKEGYIKDIRKSWGSAVENWSFSDMGENHLGAISRVARRITCSDAQSLISQITLERLGRNDSGRGSTRKTTAVDWQSLCVMDDIVVNALRRRAALDNKVSTCLDMSREELVRLRSDSVEEPPAKRRRYQRRDRDTQSFTYDSGYNDDGNQLEGTDYDKPTVPVSEDEDNHDLVVESQYESVGCKCVGLPADVLSRVSRKNDKAAGMDGDERRMSTLRVFIEADPKLQCVCYTHLLAISGHLGLQVKSLNAKDLRRRLIQCWGHRTNIDAFKVHTLTKNWWRLRCRPQIEDDKHGVYSRRMVRSSVWAGLTPERTRAIVDEISGPGAYSTWQVGGNLIVKGMFDWLFTGVIDGETCEGVGDIINTEFDMYLHHQTERNGATNKGWLRTMFYSLTQQVIRQDPQYWALYVCLRSDQSHRLVSYPYYTKYARPGDSTYFRHLDMNVPSYLACGHGASLIQGSVSLDDETSEGCTEIIPGFQRHIAAWWEKVVARGKATDGAVHGMDKLWDASDAAAFGDFTPVPCCRGDVRVTRPEIPHWSTPGRDNAPRRRTILPWSVAVREDGETLDNEESDKWSDLALAHITQKAVRLTPSGLPNKFGPIPYRFPASTQLVLSSPVSQALVCRTDWEDPVVQGHANLLMGGDRVLAQADIKRHRLEALRTFKVAWGRVMTAEGRYYGKDSFFGGAAAAIKR